MKLEVGMYVRTKNGKIAKIVDKINNSGSIHNDNIVYKLSDNSLLALNSKKVVKASYNIIDLIECMDLLEIENPIKLYGKNIKISLFNFVRCDGFTTFADGTHCIILNLDYLVDVKDLKVKTILTHEQFEKNCYNLGD